jgi:glycoside hydrolase-like protein
MHWKLIAPITLAALFGISASAADDIPVPVRSPECASNPGFTAVDFSMPLTNLVAEQGRSALEQLRMFGINTVFRYYDHVDETLPGKTLLPLESDAILSAGLKIAVVFQHHNDDPAKFLAPDAGTRDAERALQLADQNRQPYNSAIYFGIDGPERHLGPLIQEYKFNNGSPMRDDRKAKSRPYFVRSYEDFLRYGRDAFSLVALDKVTPEMMKPVIIRYFDSIHRTFQAYARQHGGNGYKIGLYCTAAMCLLGDDKKLADYFWVSPEGRNDPEYRQFLQGSDRWNLVQQLPTTCGKWSGDHRKIEFDFDTVRPQKADFGQWATKR